MLLSIELIGYNIKVKENKNVLFSGDIEIANNECYISLKGKENKTEIIVNEYKGFIKRSYEIILYGNNQNNYYELTCKSMLRGYWIIEDEIFNYEIISHNGTRISLYKNDKQVGCFNESVVNFLNRKQITINVNKNENIKLIIGIALALYVALLSNGGRGDTINLNIGQIVFEKKKYNKNWKPIND